MFCLGGCGSVNDMILPNLAQFLESRILQETSRFFCNMYLTMSRQYFQTIKWTRDIEGQWEGNCQFCPAPDFFFTTHCCVRIFFSFGTNIFLEHFGLANFFFQFWYSIFFSFCIPKPLPPEIYNGRSLIISFRREINVISTIYDVWYQ